MLFKMRPFNYFLMWLYQHKTERRSESHHENASFSWQRHKDPFRLVPEASRLTQAALKLRLLVHCTMTRPCFKND